jgi:enoyl-CoA hydratase
VIESTIDTRFVATVTVNNPDQCNALGNAGKRELAEALERVSAIPGLRVVILTGAGDKSFIGGANLKEMPGFVRHDATEGPALTHRVCEAIRRSPVPVIARINGWCLGAGLEIAASCDMRAAADTARFGMPEVLFGLPSGMEACLLPQLIGWGKTRELVAGLPAAASPIGCRSRSAAAAWPRHRRRRSCHRGKSPHSPQPAQRRWRPGSGR